MKNFERFVNFENVLSPASDSRVRRGETAPFPFVVADLDRAVHFARTFVTFESTVFMSLEDEVVLAAQTLRGVSSGLASALRHAAQRPNAPTALVDTFREADSLSLTVTAVLDEASRMLALTRPDANVIGHSPALGSPNSKVRNGFDTLAVILLKLLTIATDAGMYVFCV